MYITIEKQLTKDYKMKLGKKSRQIIKEYIENNIKVTRYEMVEPKPVPMKRVYRKPGK